MGSTLLTRLKALDSGLLRKGIPGSLAARREGVSRTAPVFPFHVACLPGAAGLQLSGAAPVRLDPFVPVLGNFGAGAADSGVGPDIGFGSPVARAA